MNARLRHIAFCSICSLILTAADPAWACSVCFGDPGSDMAKGAAAGVWVLAGVIGAVLAAVAGMSLFWIGRGRRLARLNRGDADSTGDKDLALGDSHGD